MSFEDQIKTIIGHNVPKYIEHIKSRGGVSSEELQWLHSEEDNPAYPEGMLARADEYLLYPSSEKKFEEGLFVLVLALAIMSFFPGGVEVFGLHFCSEAQEP